MEPEAKETQADNVYELSLGADNDLSRVDEGVLEHDPAYVGHRNPESLLIDLASGF